MTDLISRVDAVNAILNKRYETKGLWFGGMSEAIDVINALPSARPTGETLQNLAKPNKTCEFDIISRADAIKAVANGIWHYPSERYSNLNSYDMSEALAKDCLMSLPSVRPTGEWRASRRCSNCGVKYGGIYTNFCPNCGADMRGGEDE